jgi:alpha-amylase/alpha-mannosidase (GH57 family)
MGMVLQDFPQLHCTVNFSPVLLSQIQRYIQTDAKDPFQILSIKSPAQLSISELKVITQSFFMGHEGNIHQLSPHYYDIFQKCKKEVKLTEQEVLDLQLMGNLAWIHPILMKKDPRLEVLQQKGRGYTEAEKLQLLEIHREIIGQIVPLWRSLQERGQVEISLSPFYHPIIPLLLAKPDLAKDARVQIERAKEFYMETFGCPPVGMWPPEGSVSEESLRLINQLGFQWVATDEEILEQTLKIEFHRDTSGMINRPDLLYRLYQMEGLKVIFRDKLLSNLISFEYKSWDAREAVNDFMRRLRAIRDKVKEEAVVGVVLDGENPWEYYPNNGLEFLTGLYRALEREPGIRTVKLAEYIREARSVTPLEGIYAGSWIQHSFSIWDGHEEDKRAWESVINTRNLLEQAELKPEDMVRMAWESLWAAEGSDWFWWFGEEFCSAHEREFDQTFRKHLINVYTAAGLPIPETLYRPIKAFRTPSLVKQPWAFLEIQLDGRRSDYFEWIAAGHCNLGYELSTMSDGIDHFLTDIYFGFDETNLFLRLDVRDIQRFLRSRVYLILLEPQPCRYQITDCSPVQVAVEEIIECRIPFKSLATEVGDMVKFYIEVEEKGIRRRFPKVTPLTFQVPSEEFEKMNWQV